MDGINEDYASHGQNKLIMITLSSWGDNQAANTNEIQIWNIKLVFGKIFYFGSNLQHHLSLLLITMNSCPWHGSLSKATKAKCFYQFRYRRTDCTDNCLPSLISFLYVCGRESMPVWPALQWYIVITTHSQLWLLQGTLGKICKNEQWSLLLFTYGNEKFNLEKIHYQCLFITSPCPWSFFYAISLCAKWRCSADCPGAFSLSSSWWITRVRVGNSYSRLSQIQVFDWLITQWDGLSLAVRSAALLG